MRLRLSGLVLAGVVFTGLYAVNEYDKSTNYVPTDARVVKVEESCYMKKTSRGIGSKTTSTTKEGPCKLVEAINKNHPEFQDYRVVKTTYVEFKYKSPVDGKTHRGRHKQSKHENGKPIKRGDVLAVLAHKDNADKTSRK